MHVVIGGYGRVGRFLARELEARGNTVAVIDRFPDVFEEFEPIRGTRLVGEVFDRDTLLKAGIEKADAYAAVTSGDNSNIVSARIARKEFGVETVVARIFDPRRASIYEQLGIPTVSAISWASVRLLAMILEPSVASEFAIGPQAEIVLVETEAPPESFGKRLIDIELPRLMHVTAIERMGSAFMPADLDVIREGDFLHISVVRESVAEVDDFLKGATGAAPPEVNGTEAS